MFDRVAHGLAGGFLVTRRNDASSRNQRLLFCLKREQDLVINGGSLQRSRLPSAVAQDGGGCGVLYLHATVITAKDGGGYDPSPASSDWPKLQLQTRAPQELQASPTPTSSHPLSSASSSFLSHTSHSRLKLEKSPRIRLVDP